MQAPLCVEGWDEALQEMGRLSSETVLSTQNANSLLKAVKDIPVLVVAGAEDALVPLKSVQYMASKLVNSVSTFLAPSLKFLMIFKSFWIMVEGKSSNATLHNFMTHSFVNNDRD